MENWCYSALCALPLKTKHFPRLFALVLYPSAVTSISAMFLYPKAPVPSVTNFRVIEEGLFSLKVAWTPSLGKVEGYRIYIPKGEFRLDSFLLEFALKGAVTQGHERCHYGPQSSLVQVSVFQTMWFLQNRAEFIEGLSVEEQGRDNAENALYPFALSHSDHGCFSCSSACFGVDEGEFKPFIWSALTSV